MPAKSSELFRPAPALLVDAGRGAVRGFESRVRDNDRAQGEMAEHLAKQCAAEITRTIGAGQAARVEQLQLETWEARH